MSFVPQFSATSVRTPGFCALLLAVAALTAVALVRGRSSHGMHSAVPLASTVASNPARLNPPTNQIPVALITIRPTGFDPTEISRSAGEFLLAVDNRSGLDELTLYLTREGGARVREDHLSPEHSRLRERIELPAGTYWLTEANHEQWRCRIIIGS